MSICRNQLKSFLEEHTPDYGLDSIDSLLDLLREVYTKYNPIDTDIIRKRIAELRPVMEALSLEQSDLLFDLIAQLCYETERTAFREGIHVGMRLAAELDEANILP